MFNSVKFNLTERDERTASVAAILALTVNPRRFRLPGRLSGHGIPVGALAASAGASQSALSRHLATMRARGRTAPRREAQTIFHSLAIHQIRAAMTALRGLFCRHRDEHESRLRALMPVIADPPPSGV